MPPAVRVLAAVVKYAAFGVVPLVIPSILEDIPIPVDRIPRHQGTDYKYVKALAEEAGYVFYIDPGPVPLMSKAYWGPEIRVGVPQPALSLALDGPHVNLKSLNFRFDKERKEFPVVYIQEPASKAPIPIPIPDITPLSPPLGLIPPIPKNFEIVNQSAKYSPVQATLIGLARAAKTSDAVTATGTIDVTRYGRTLKARRLVGLRGVGTAFDGLYYVKSVTHTIKRGEYKQTFSLVRNGLISTTASVPA
jgi:hypothetical protein